MDATDRTAVLARARDGDEEAFRVLVEEYSHRVFQLAYRITGNTQDAEDVVQESFLRAYRYLGRFEARANFGSWLYRIAANCALNVLREKRRRDRRFVAAPDDGPLARASSGGPGPEQLAAGAEIERRITDALECLTPLERTAFTLRHYHGQSIDEICRTLKIKSSATKNGIFRAVRKLRAALEPVRGSRIGTQE
jgi:RNA polymerase sigma-70 factor (ECF subfamily)